ncbi:hypothetical protein [Poriferisphaera sp. WC338]|uniref:hypothetical protein n=1 Tax=Poriferisphaera sp. WC338 TaxID=3425129 RepID=UPI003D81B37A
MLIASFLLGLALLQSLSPIFQNHSRTLNKLFNIIVALPFGLTISSVLYFFATIVNIPLFITLIIEATIITVLYLAIGQKKYKPSPHTANQSSKTKIYLNITQIILILFGITLAVTATWQFSQRNPYGKWDAWDMWNHKARILFYQGNSPIQRIATETSHPDYPLFQPIIIAQLWLSNNQINTLTPQLLGPTFLGLTALLIAISLALLRTPFIATASTLLLFASPHFISRAASQYADNTVALYMSFALLATLLSLKNPQLLILSGLATGGAMWTKNEGILFAIGLSLAIALITFSHNPFKQAVKNLAAYFIGLAPFLLCILMLRFGYNTQNDLTANPDLKHVFDISRHQAIWRIIPTVLKQIAPLYIWYILGLLIITNLLPWRKQQWAERTICIVPLVIMLIGFYVSYLLTPHELSWHLANSSDRLLVQLWPMIIIAVAIFIQLPLQPLINPQP